MADTDRMVVAGVIPGLDHSTERTVRVDRPVYRDYGELVLPGGVRLDVAGITALRAVLDRAENEIRAYQGRVRDDG